MTYHLDPFLVGFVYLPGEYKRHTLCYNSWVEGFSWSSEKNESLREKRGVTFEDVVIGLSSGSLLDVMEHPNQVRYPGQSIFVVQILDYVYLVPFVETDDGVFLKTIIPSRKATRRYLGEHNG